MAKARSAKAAAWASKATRLKARWTGRARLVLAHGAIALYGAEIRGASPTLLSRSLGQSLAIVDIPHAKAPSGACGGVAGAVALPRR